jgi:steroid delta-isomerase-like uncharacterized protein
MSPDENKTLNDRWIEAFNARDWAAEAACRTADYKAHMSGAPGPLDAAGWNAFMATFSAAFPDARISIDDAVAERDIVASRWTLTATHRGDFQGVPPTGRPVTMQGVDISRVVNGKIAEHWAQFDLIAVMQQIGAMPAPR